MNRVRIGLYSVGLQSYWDQFSGLKERLTGYNRFIANQLSAYGTVCDFGMVDTPEAGLAAGQYFARESVDILFVHVATYCTSSCILPVHQSCRAPAVILNLQPAVQMNYEHTGTGEWLAQCTGCAVPEVSNAFRRSGIRFRCVNGLLGLKDPPPSAIADEKTDQTDSAKNAWKAIGEWVKAAQVISALKRSRFGFLGGYYTGMLDMYADFTLLSAKLGIQIVMLEMCDLNERLKSVTEKEILQKKREIWDFFILPSGDSADPIAHQPTEEELDWSARVACAQEKMTHDFSIDALSYYYHGTEGSDYAALQSGFIVGHSLLTAKGIPCAGEGDIKTCAAMKICDLLGVGGSFSEIVAMDYKTQTMLVGHDGPFHLLIADGKPFLRGVNIYHGKRGSGISVEAQVKPGPITMLGLAQTDKGLRMVCREGMAEKLPILRIGNTQTHVNWGTPLDEFMDRMFSTALTHHFSLSVGHNHSLFTKVADLLEIEMILL